MNFISKPVRAEEISRTLLSLFGDRAKSNATSNEASPASAEQSKEPEGPSSINRSELLANLSDDMELLGEMIDMFLEREPGQSKAIAEAIERSEADALRRAAHSLKSAASNFFCDDVLKAAYDLEWMGRNSDLKGAPAAFELLQQRLTVMRTELFELRKQCTEAESAQC